MDIKTEKRTIPQQVKIALDGRTQRWLSFETRIGEPQLSLKMKGAADFSEEEILKIEQRLNFKIERG